MEAAKRFNQGFATVEYLAAALVDMKLHTDPSEEEALAEISWSRPRGGGAVERPRLDDRVRPSCRAVEPRCDTLRMTGARGVEPARPRQNPRTPARRGRIPERRAPIVPPVA
jgi:hypothetical protein